MTHQKLIVVSVYRGILAAHTGLSRVKGEKRIHRLAEKTFYNNPKQKIDDLIDQIINSQDWR